MPSKKSGGKRATEKKNREREAARSRDPKFVEERRQRLAAIADKATTGKAELSYGWLGDVAIELIRDALLDIGLPPEQQREQIGRLIAQAARCVDPARMAQKLEELERALEEARASAQPTRPNRTPSERAPLQ